MSVTLVEPFQRLVCAHATQYATVFTNGNLDPWHVGGILTSLSPSLPAILIDGGAHHLDLFFSNPADPPSVIEARKVQLENIALWIEQKRAAVAHPLL